MSISEIQEPPSIKTLPEGNKVLELKIQKHQVKLYEALKKIDSMLATIYYGSLCVLNDSRNPDCFPLAAHGIRELMGKLPANIELPQEKHDAKTKSEYKLGDHVKNLKVIWVNICKNIDEYISKEHIEIDKKLKNFLVKLKEFFDKYEKERPARKKEISKMLIKLDPSKRFLPPKINELRVDEWSNIKDYFVAVAHHDKEIIVEEFNGWLYTFEEFLLNRFYPQTFLDYDNLDAMIKYGEKNDK